MSAGTVSLWREDRLEPRDGCDVLPATIEAADSWLVVEGAVRGLDLHRARFMTAIPRGRYRESSCAPSCCVRSCCCACARPPR
jgi:hypothetical protein